MVQTMESPETWLHGEQRGKNMGIEATSLVENSGNRERDSRGRFVRGHTKRGGNPKGSVHKLIGMARDALADVLPDVIEEARAGDEKARKLLFEYGMPRIRPTSLPIAMPSDPEGILQAMAEGSLSPDVAQDAMAVHLAAGKLHEMEVLEQRMAAMEEAMRQIGGKV